jgi:hypothetical protein
MDWMRLERSLTAWSAWYRPRLGRVVAAEPGTEFHLQEQALYEAIDCKVEDLKLAQRVDTLERLAVVAEEACRGRAGGYWTEIRDLIHELKAGH